MAKALWICYFGTALICQWLFYHFPKTIFCISGECRPIVIPDSWPMGDFQGKTFFPICIPSVFAFHHLPALDPVFGVLFSARLHQSPCYRHMVVRSRPDCLGCTPHIGTVSRSVPSTPLQTAFHTRACGSFACFVRRFLRSSRHLRMAGDSN